MHGRDSFDLYFLARGEGMGVRGVAELGGVPESICDGWDTGQR